MHTQSHRTQFMLVAGSLCAVTLLAMLVAAMAGAPGSAFISICTAGLAAVTATVLFAQQR